ncbi:uncharacterized protein LOC143301261 [Babylonia areolata]|uniref:uncharacterized protein LOC143301261 n=1 Tax=Babylonia areolata TaxID=304850 RepID=UPI003FD066BC
MMIAVRMAANTTPHRLPPLIYPKPVSPTSQHEHGGRGLHESRGVPEGPGTKDRQEKAARKREQARRHLSNSLQGMKTVLPDLRRTQSFSVPAVPSGAKEPGRAGWRRDTASLGPRKPLHDLHEVRAGVRRRSRSLREAGSSMESPPHHPLSHSLPQPANISLAALVHELNASMHYHHHNHPSRRLSPDSSLGDEDTIDELFDYENGLDPDLCPRLTGHGHGHGQGQGQDASEMPDRTLTPALRKLNRRRVSSRVRTQQWVNQIDREQRHGERRQGETETAGKRGVPQGASLLYEHGT